eukprot:g19967.t1
MPSEAYRRAVQKQSERALSSYDNLVSAIGEKKAETQRREAVEKLNEKVDTAKRDAAKQSMVDRYAEVASAWELPLGTYASVYEFLAVSLDTHPTFEEHKKIVKILKNKELWIVGREMSDDPAKARCDPIHLVVGASTVVTSLGLSPLLNRQQRDDLISKIMMARAAFGESGATQVFGSVMEDTQEVSVEVAGATFWGRFTAWIDNDLSDKWKDAYRRQERLAKEQEQMAKLREQQEQLIQRQLAELQNAAPYGKGRKARAELRAFAAEAKKRNEELFESIDKELRKPKVTQKLGLWEVLGQKYHQEDPVSWEVWQTGLECIGKCKCPPHWVDKERVKPVVPVADFRPSKVVQDVVAGKHKKPCWGDALIEKTWKQTLEETQVVPELGYEMLRGPFPVKNMEEVRFGFRRFPREQKAGKVRMIDPAVSAGECSELDKDVPIPTPQDILANAAVAHDPSVRDKVVVQHTRRIIKKCRRAEKRYEEQLLQFFKGEREEVGGDLIKKGATQPKRGEKPVFNDESEEVVKKRRRESGEKVGLEIVVVDVAKCYKSILVKLAERKFSRLLAYNPEKQVCEWFESIVAIFGSKHSVTGWQRQGKFLRSIKRRLYKLNTEDYVDDFTSFVKKGLGKVVVEAMLELLDELGLPAMVEKVALGEELEVLGLMFSVANGVPEMYLTEKKKEQVRTACQKARETGVFELDELETFVGRLTFALSAIADRALSPVLRPLRRMLSKEQREVDVSVRTSLRAIESLMDLDLRRRVSFEDPAALNVMLYTDASWEKNTGWLGAVLAQGGKMFMQS